MFHEIFDTISIGDATFLLFADGMVNSADVRSIKYIPCNDGDGSHDRFIVAVQFRGDPTPIQSHFRPWDGERAVVEADSTVS